MSAVCNRILGKKLVLTVCFDLMEITYHEIFFPGCIAIICLVDFCFSARGLIFIFQPTYLHNHTGLHTANHIMHLPTATLSIHQSNHSPGCLNFQLTKTITWLWRWLQHGLLKRQSQTIVLLRTPITQMIFFNQGMLEVITSKSPWSAIFSSVMLQFLLSVFFFHGDKLKSLPLSFLFWTRLWELSEHNTDERSWDASLKWSDNCQIFSSITTSWPKSGALLPFLFIMRETAPSYPRLLTLYPVVLRPWITFNGSLNI